MFIDKPLLLRRYVMNKNKKRIIYLFLIIIICMICFRFCDSFTEVTNLILDNHYVISLSDDENDLKELRYYKEEVDYNNINEKIDYSIIIKPCNILSYYHNEIKICLRINQDNKIIYKIIDKKTKNIKLQSKMSSQIKWEYIEGIMFK